MLRLSPDEALAYYMNLVFFVPTPENIPEQIIDDPFDNVFLALASDHKAQLIVSGDRHLLTLKEHNEIQIVTPGEACAVIQELFELNAK
jgi:predicted nucleic acid-binding protein